MPAGVGVEPPSRSQGEPEASLGLDAAAQRIFEALGATDVLVFGSAARGVLRPESDVDLAFLSPERPPAETRLALLGELGEIVGRPVDLVSLGDAGPILAMQVLRGGRSLLRPPSRELAWLTMRVVSMYADLKRVRAPAEAALRESYS